MLCLMGMNKNWLKAMVLTAGLVVGGGAQAASLTFCLNQSNVLADGGQYLKVKIDDDGAPGLINFTVSTLDALNQYSGNGFGIQVFAFNTLLPTSGLSSNSFIGLPENWKGIVAPKDMKGFGEFEVVVEGKGYDGISTLKFSIMREGDTLNDYLQMSTGNAYEGSAFYSANILGFKGGLGFASAKFGGSMQVYCPTDVPNPVPVPAAVWLFGSSLLGLAGFARRRQR